MVWVGTDFKDHLMPTPLPLTETHSTRQGGSPIELGHKFFQGRVSTASVGNRKTEVRCYSAADTQLTSLKSHISQHKKNIDPEIIINLQKLIIKSEM